MPTVQNDRMVVAASRWPSKISNEYWFRRNPGINPTADGVVLVPLTEKTIKKIAWPPPFNHSIQFHPFAAKINISVVA